MWYPRTGCQRQWTTISSREFAQFMTSLGIKHYQSAVYHPATNGAVEQLVKTLKQSLKAAHLAETPSKRALNDFLCKYGATPHAVTGVTPGELFLGRPIRTMLDLLKPNFRESVEQKQYHDRRRSRQLNVEEGDQVLVRVYIEGLIRWRPGIVMEVIGNRAVRVKLQSGTEVTRHLDQIQWGSFDVPLADEIIMDTEVDTHSEPITGLDSPSPVVDSPAKEATEFSSQQWKD